jgi:hypothetical protein
LRQAGGQSLPAAILGQEADQPIHAAEVGRVDELAANAALREQASAVQMLNMEGQRRGRQAEALGDDAGREPIRSLLHQYAIDRQSRFVREGAQSLHSLATVHYHHLSRNIE